MKLPVLNHINLIMSSAIDSYLLYVYNPINMNEREKYSPVNEFERGFLPPKDPLRKLPQKEFGEVEELGTNIPTLLEKGELRSSLRALEPVNVGLLNNEREMNRAFMLYTFLANANVHAIGEEKINIIPKGVAIPLVELADRLEAPPILSYKPYGLDNFYRRDPLKPIELGKKKADLGNLDTLVTFTHLPDEKWFILTHTEIEQEAAPIINSAINLQDTAELEVRSGVLKNLQIIERSTGEMADTLSRMTEGNRTEVYFKDFRPYIQLYSNVVYEGVKKFEGKPQSFRGETRVQSSIMPLLDTLLGVEHKETGMTKHIADMRVYMPKSHRNFIKTVEAKGRENGTHILRRYLSQSGNTELKDAYNSTLENMSRFRGQHLEWANIYIAQKAKRMEAKYGTGNTEFLVWLQELKDETLAARLK